MNSSHGAPKPGKIDVLDETAVVAVRVPLMAGGQDEAAHAPAECRFRPVRPGEKQLGTAPLVVTVHRVVHRVVKPQRNLHGVAIRKQRRDFVEPAQAIADVMQIVEAPIRRAEAAAQLGMDVAGGSGIRGRDTTAPQRVEPCSLHLARVHRLGRRAR